MKLIKKLFIFIIIILILSISLIVFKGYKMYTEAIKETPIEDKINEIKNRENYIKIDNIDEDFKNAIIAVEDHRFYNHKGIDLISTTKAIFINIKNKELTTGGSSITQQLAKNMYFSLEKKFSRKIAEIFVVSYLEENLTKDEILELYLNTIYYGNGYYGINNASLGYFDKNANDLTLNEATILAGLPNAPSAYSLDKNKELAKKRQKQVLNAMIKYNYITEENVQKVINEE